MSRTTQYIHHERSLGDALLKVSDSACVFAGFAAAAACPNVPIDSRYWLAAAIAAIIVHLVGEVSGLYRGWRGVSLNRELAVVLVTCFYSLSILVTLGVLTRYTDVLPRATLIVASATIISLFTLSRLAVRYVQRSRRSRGIGQRKMAIVGVNELGIRLARNLEDSPELGLQLVGFFDDRPSKRTGDLPEDVGKCLGSIRELVEQARAGEIHRVYITLPLRAEKRVRDVLNRLADTTASVYIVPDFFVFELLHSRWTAINGLPVVSVFENPFYGVDGLLKRICDIGLASVFLALAAFPMAVIALVIKSTSPGPIFFRQKRYGLDGREILVWKFRSMSVCENDQVRQARRNDPRVTRVGAVLRRTSLDELPQLFNVLEGSMSLVGPRPHATAHNEQFRRLIPGYMLRHKVKPGITGLAQVLGFRGETDSLDKMADRIQCDLQYIREWSLWMDVKILFRTVRVVISGQNAY
jgi:putative colanic acid biosynthesis UDP-glucose lipid carrier transferase